MIEPTTADCAYAAGFFDGEGTVFIAANHGVKEARGTIYNMRVLASQVDPTPLAWMQERWGGSLVQRGQRGSQRPNWVWNCKPDEADVALEFQAAAFNPGVRGHTPEYRDRQETQRQQLMELKRGRERIAI